MKKGLIVAVIALAMIGFTTSSFAKKYNKSLGVSYWTYEGQVAELIPAQSALIVKDNEDGQDVHIHVDKDTLSELKVGDVIEFDMQGTMCMVRKVTRK